MELSIVIPAYNEEKRLPPTLNRVLAHLKENYKKDFELIVVDDGSGDNTRRVVEEFHAKYPEVSLLAMSHNCGYGAAVREGMLAAQGEYVLTMDADGSTNEEAIVRFLEFLRTHPEIMLVIGSRNLEGSKILTAQSAFRVLLGNIFLIMAKVLFGWPMYDRILGFKMFRREAIKDIFSHQYENTFLAAAEVAYTAEKRGWAYTLLPVLWTDYRDSRVRPFRDAWRSFWGMFTILRRDQSGMYRK